MTEKKAQTKLYKYVGQYPRGENGKRVTKGDNVDLSHLSEKEIKRLVRMGYYKEVS